MNTAEALIIAVARLEDILKAEALIIAVARLEDLLQNDDGQAWKETAKVLPQLQQAVARAQQTESELLTARKAMAADEWTYWEH